MDVKLVVLGGKNHGQGIPVRGPKFVIGRAEDCQLRPGSDLVSRQHCVILLAEGYVAIRDFGSRNGTYVNGDRITGEQELKSGDKIKVGPLEFEVQLSVSVSGKKKPKVNSVQEAAVRNAETAAPRDKELDITQWLSEEGVETLDDDLAREKVNAKTIALSTKEAEAANNTIVAKASETKAGTARQAIDPLANHNVVNEKTAPNSRAAAADMLKQLLNRRK
jgi:pSer/pThr/pTyr-binding forkhead associated (FHA) protein